MLSSFRRHRLALHEFENRPKIKRLTRLAVVADQGFVSVTNLVLALVMVRHYLPADYASYALALFLALAVAGAYRVALAVPISLWAPAQFSERRRAVSSLHLTAISLTLVLSATATIIVTLSHPEPFWHRTSTIIIALVVNYMCLDIDRAMVMRRFGTLASTIMSFASSFVILMIAASILTIHPAIELSALFIGLSALIKTLIIHGSSAKSFDKNDISIWRSIGGTSMSWGMAGNIASSVYMTAPQWLLGAQGDVRQIAGFAAVRTPLQPLMLLLRSFDIFDKLSFGERSAHDGDTARSHQLRLTVFYLAASAAFALVAAIFARPIIDIVLGPTYEEFTNTLRLSALSFCLIAVAAPLETLLFSRGLHKTYAWAQFAGAALCAAVIVPLVTNLRAEGAVLAGMIGWIPPYVILVANMARRQS